MGRSRLSYRPLAPMGQKWCPYGSHFAPLGDFQGGYCKIHAREYAKTHNHNEKAAEEAKTMRLEGISHYGGKCYSCGNTDSASLLFTPSRGVGVIKQSRWLKHQGWPKTNAGGHEYKLICSNCLRKSAQKPV